MIFNLIEIYLQLIMLYAMYPFLWKQNKDGCTFMSNYKILFLKIHQVVSLVNWHKSFLAR